MAAPKKVVKAKPKTAEVEAFNVYEVAMASRTPGQAFEQHVRARDEDEAKAKVMAAQGPGTVIEEVRFRRECSAEENQQEAEKAGLA